MDNRAAADYRRRHGADAARPTTPESPVPGQPDLVGPLRPPGRPAALLVDMDGTLVDTEPLWAAAVAEVAAEHGARWGPRDAHRLVGVLVPDLAALLVSRGAAVRPDTLVARLVDDVAQLIGDRPPWRPGALDLLTALVEQDVPAALVTTSYRRHALAVAAAGPTGALRVVVAAEDVERHKPDPQAYRAAMDRLGVGPDAAFALEDSVPGLRAALAAGVVTLAVQPGTPLPDDVAHHPRLTRVSGLAQARSWLGL